MLKRKLIYFAAAFFCLMALSGCGKGITIPSPLEEIGGHGFIERVPLEYADRFAIDRYEDGCSMIYTCGGDKYLITPDGEAAADNDYPDAKIIHRGDDSVYLAATAVMSFFDALDKTDNIKFASINAEDWYIASAREAMENGDIIYAGKYREPDYELLVSCGCDLSIQSTMIEHSPDVKEKLEELGITVFEDYSSYEAHPLGRCEWIKVYGEITGKTEEAEKLFREQTQYISDDCASTGKTAAFFYINNSSQAVTRKSGDYVSKMIELAGGENIFKNLGTDGAASSVTMEAEDFYSKAKDADFIIYNSTIGGEISTLDDLLKKSGLLGDFKAVRNGNVWCTRNNLYQECMKTGAMISDFNAVFTGNTESNPPQFLYKLEGGAESE